MAVYKVIQDIEAEDKLLGPLTLKSFIYAAIAGLLIFIEVRLLISGAPAIIRLVIIFVLLFPTLLFAILASPLGRDQPTEVWLLSHVRFLLKPRQRTWNQSGISQLVTITAPKRLDKHLTKELSQTEVQSRLQALAGTLDSRGWVVKNSAVNLGGQSGYLDSEAGGDSDRLIGTSSLVQQAPMVDVHPADDILDEVNNSTAQHFNELMQQADVQRKQDIMNKIDNARKSPSNSKGENTKFIDSAQKDSKNTRFVGREVIAPQSSGAETAAYEDTELLAEAKSLLEAQHKRNADIHRRSASFKPKTQSPAKPAQATVTATQAAAKLELAQSGNGLSVASIAHLANRVGQAQQISPNEVAISLH